MILDDVHWCALTLGEQKRQLKEINHGDEWFDKVSILVYSLTYDKVDKLPQRYCCKQLSLLHDCCSRIDMKMTKCI
jgi:hypothetical protein